MDIMTQTPYKDRYCKNCAYHRDSDLENCFKCIENQSYVAGDCWCSAWLPEHRVYKFEN